MWLSDQEEKERVPKIGDGQAPGIAVHTEVASARIGVVAGLIETHATISVHFVHRHLRGLILRSINDDEVCYIVRRRQRSSGIDHLEAGESDIERKIVAFCLCHRRHHRILVRGLVAAQVYRTFEGSGVGEPRTQQYHDEGEVEQK